MTRREAEFPNEPKTVGDLMGAPDILEDIKAGRLVVVPAVPEQPMLEAGEVALVDVLHGVDYFMPDDGMHRVLSAAFAASPDHTAGLIALVEGMERERDEAKAQLRTGEAQYGVLDQQNKHLLARSLAAEAERDNEREQVRGLMKTMAAYSERAVAAEAALAKAVDGPVYDGSIEVRLNDKGGVDEIVALGVICHIERLSTGTWFVSLTRPDQTEEAFWLAGKGSVEVCHTEHRTAPATGPNAAPWTLAAAIRKG